MIERAYSVRIATALTVLGLMFEPCAVRADQVRDWMFAAQPAGTYLNTDAVLPGVQAQLEHRIWIYGPLNELDLKINALPTLFYYESQADVELRVLVFTLGVSAGFRDTFFNLEFGRKESFGLEARREAEDKGQYSNALTGFGDGRVTLAVPFNDNLALLSVNGARYDSGGDRTFDWRLAIVRDAGVLLHSNTTLFFHHRGFGAIGPQVEVLSYRLNDNRNTQVNLGFTYVGRLGVKKRFDLLFLTVLVGASGKINGVDTADVYGDHYLNVPISVQLAYRIVWELAGPHEAGSD